MGWIIAIALVIGLIVSLAEYILPLIAVLALIIAFVSLFIGIKSAAEKKGAERKAALSREIDAFCARYKMEKMFPKPEGQSDALHAEAVEFITKKENAVTETIAEFDDVNGGINTILSCPNCAKEKEKLAFLKSKQGALDALKSERDALHGKILGEYARVAAVLEEAEKIIVRYGITNEDIPSVNLSAKPYKGAEPCEEMVKIVKHHKQELAGTIAEYRVLEGKINGIFAAFEGFSPDEKLEYLQKKQIELAKLKSEATVLLKKISASKIKINSAGSQKLGEIKKAVAALSESKKCTSETTSLSAFRCGEAPAELALFSYECAPETICVGGFCFCIFSDIVLVFDKFGVFSSAILPSEVKLSVERKQTKYSTNENIGEDSKAVTFEEKRMRWLHETKNGTPDRRYKDNPVIEYTVPVSGYEYGVVSVSVGESTAKFSVSSSDALDKFESAKNSRNRGKKAASDAPLIEIEAAKEEEFALAPNTIETKNRR